MPRARSKIQQPCVQLLHVSPPGGLHFSAFCAARKFTVDVAAQLPQYRVVAIVQFNGAHA
jgi:hypothetical protein